MADMRLCMCAGPIDFRHAFLDMTGIEVREGPNTRAGRTCPAAMGFSFAAGTTDGMYVRFFYQSTCVVMYANHQPFLQVRQELAGHCKATKAKRSPMLSGCLYVYLRLSPNNK